MIFRPMFSLADMVTATIATALMLNGHWLASVPVMALGAIAASYGRKRTPRMPAARIVRIRHAAISEQSHD